jgi:hypothetical protein
MEMFLFECKNNETRDMSYVIEVRRSLLPRERLVVSLLLIEG